MKRNLLLRIAICALALLSSDYAAVSQTITTFAGGGGSLGDGGQATAALVMGPFGICIDAAGNKYIAQDGTARVRKITPSGIITTIAGTGTLGADPDGLQATATRLKYPRDLATDAAGNLYISEYGDYSAGNGRIRKLTMSTGIISTVAGGGASTAEGIAATSSSLSPNRIRFDAAGAYLYVSDGLTNKVKRINMSTGIITTVAGNGTAGTLSSNVEGIAATAYALGQPDGIAFDAAGNLYVSQQGVYRVSVVKTDGNIYTIAGTGVSGYDGDGVATAHKVHIPFGLAVDGNNNLLIAEYGNNLVRKVDLATGMMTTLAGTTVFGETGDGGAATDAQLSSPMAVTTDADGKIYICDVNGAKVRVISATACTTPTVNVTGGGTVCQDIGSTLTATGATTYTWAPGTGLSSTTGTSVTATPGSTTTYTVTGSMGTCSNTATVTISITPSANISGTTQVCKNQTTTLSGIPSGGSWSSNASGTASVGISDGVVTGNNVGSTTITYTPTSGCYTTTTVNVNALPTVDISGANSVCLGSSISLASTINTSYVWTPATSLSCATCQTTSASPTGTTIYTVTGTNANGCSATNTKTITVDTISVSVSPNKSICAGTSDTLNATGAVTYSWLPVAGLSSPSGATVNATPGGSTTYTVTGTNGACTQAKTVTLLVNSLPGAITGSTQVCKNFTTTLNCTPAGGTWISNAPGIASVGSGNGVVAGNNVGSATITYTSTTGCIQTTTVNVSAQAAISIVGSDAICRGTSGTLSASVQTTYSWAPVSGLSCTTCQNPTPSPTVTTTYTVSGTDGSGCVNTGTKTITVDTISVTVSPNKSICSGSSDTLNAAGAVSYSWIPVASLSSPSGATVTATPGGNTTYTVIGTKGACTQSKTVVLSVNPATSAISGIDQWCKGTTTTFSCTPTGGTWSSSAPTIASVGSTTGVVNGVNGGTAKITYTKSGCSSVKDVTVILTPAITGVSSVCLGLTVPMTNASPGGTWTSSIDTIASIDTFSGVLTGLYEGSTTITYTASSGCYATKQFTVGLPPAIIGNSWACLNQTVDLDHPIEGGTWSSSNPARASVDAVSGVVHGLSLGNFYITYTLGTGCKRIMEMAVQTYPLDITGSMSICYGTSTTLGDETPSGTWSSSDTSVASISVSTGTVIGLNSGITTITYKFQACYHTEVLTVNALPVDITGANELCAGSDATYSSTPSSGTWLSSNASKITVDYTTGIATGVSAGTALLTYTAPVTGCSKTKNITINSQPGVLSGNLAVCAGNSTTITSSSEGGTWSSSDETVATAGSTLSWSTTVSGLLPGTTTITATNGLSCSRSTVVTVSAAPSTIAGDDVVCPGGTIQLTNSTGGGTWSSSATAKATVGSTGVVMGVATGTATISYRTSATCYTVKQITINSTPGAVSGPATVCIGSNVTLSHAETGGTWVSSTPSRASIDATSGQVTGVSTGAVTITYNVNSGCMRTFAMNVNASPSAISGNSSVCIGSTTTLTNTAAGTWSSSNTAIATVPSSPATVGGVSAGIATITFKVTSTGCIATQDVTVNALPTDISGANQLCIGGNESYTSLPASGTWTSSTNAIGTIGLTSGTLTGIAAGATTISYISPLGCRKTRIVTVNALPAAITGTFTACANNTTTLNSTTAGLAWSSGNTDVATTGTALPTTTIVSAIGTGTVAITATNTAGCTRSAIVSVNAALPAITGGTTLCIGGTTQLSNTAPSGTWSSSATGTATVNTAGLVNGVTAGSVNISYKTNATCITVKQVSVSATPAAITGPSGVCIGSTVQLLHAIEGGSWVSSLPSRASVDGVSGLVTGVSAGSVTITYNTAAGCFKTYAMVVNPLPAAIYGTMTNVCQGATTQFSDATTGGTWSSSSTGTATVSITGLVTGVNDGTATITYKITATGCLATRDITIDSLPTVITGAAAICIGSTETYSSMPAGGTWISSATVKATIGNTSGMATGVAVGTTLLSYIAPGTGCRITRSIAVNAVPAAITGISTICVGNTVVLTSTTASQTWSSTLVAATVSSLTTTTASLTGISAGITTISYTNAAGCASKLSVTVNDAVPEITGERIVCPTRVINLGMTAEGGTWSSALATKATVNSTGAVTGVNAGTVNISYTVSPGCYSVATVTINAVPATITGPTSVCPLDMIDLNHTAIGGTWSANNSNVVVDAETGGINGVSSGTSVVTYAINSGCFVTSTVTIKAQPAAIGGSLAIATGSTSLLTNATGGGTWSSANTDIATVGSTTGVMIGVAGGNTIITYRVTATSCYAIAEATVSDIAPRQLVGMSNITIYPNPTSRMLTIEASAEGTFIVYTLDGKALHQYQTKAPLTTVELPNNLAAGVYMCRFDGVDGSSRIVRIVYQP